MRGKKSLQLRGQGLYKCHEQAVRGYERSTISPKLPESLRKVHDFLEHIPCAVSPALLGMSPDLLPGFKQETMAQKLWQKRDLGAATPELHLCDFSSILRDWGAGLGGIGHP